MKSYKHLLSQGIVTNNDPTSETRLTTHLNRTVRTEGQRRETWNIWTEVTKDHNLVTTPVRTPVDEREPTYLKKKKDESKGLRKKSELATTEMAQYWVSDKNK